MKGMLVVGLLLAGGWHGSSSDMEVLVDGVAAPKYYHERTAYLEAFKGKEYAIRLTNPTGGRVAVALSVDGLNTIDARHTEARLARKWVLDAYESVVISGWQTGSHQARRFFFTTEEQSYGAKLGKTANLGIISAAFFRERYRPEPVAIAEPTVPMRRPGSVSDSSRERAANSERIEAASASSKPEYAATGIGDRVRHEVEWVHMELEDQPFTVVNVRYEFRPVLVKLGILPPAASGDALSRRERARGFRGGLYCPEP